MIPNSGVSGTVDYIAGKMGLDGKQDATNNLRVSINPMVNIQPATQVQYAECAGCGTDNRPYMCNVLQSPNSERSKG